MKKITVAIEHEVGFRRKAGEHLNCLEYSYYEMNSFGAIRAIDGKSASLTYKAGRELYGRHVLCEHFSKNITNDSIHASAYELEVVKQMRYKLLFSDSS